MNDSDLNELLATIDLESETPDDVEGRVWERVRHDFEGEVALRSVVSVIPEVRDVRVIPTDIMPITENSARRHHWVNSTALFAAAVIVVVGLVLAVVLRENSNDQTDLATGADVDATLPTTPGTLPGVVVERDAACAQFLSTAGPLIGVEDSFRGSGESTTEGLGVTIEALEQLALDFRSQPERDEVSLSAIEMVIGALRQAELHVRNGEDTAALEAFDFAESAYRGSSLASDTCLGP